MMKRYVVNDGFDPSPNGSALELSSSPAATEGKVGGHGGPGRRETGADPPDDTSVKLSGDVTKDEDHVTAPCCPFGWMGEVKNAIKRHRVPICLVVKVLVFLLYLAYTVYSLYRTWGTESATRLLVLLVIVLYAAVGRRLLKLFQNLLPKPTTRGATASKLRKIARWSLYVLAAGGAIVFLAVEVIPHHPNNLVCLLGLAALFIACLAMSTDPTHVNWHPVFWGSALQFYLAIFILRTQAGIDTFAWLSDRVLEFTRYTDAGTSLLFGQAYTMHPYAFQLLPVFIFVNAALAVGHHFGIIEGFVSTIGRVLSFCLGTTAVESVSAAANIFLSALEAPLLVFPYLAKCSESEIFAVMTGGFASVSAGFLAVYASLGVPADHLLAASVMSAPAALAIAKIVCPETSDTNTDSDTVRIEAEEKTGLLESVTKAAHVGMKVVMSAGLMLIVFAAFLDFADSTVHWFGVQAGVDDLSFKVILSYLFYPLSYVCGSDTSDLLTVGRLTGVKIVANNILAYQELGQIIRNNRVMAGYNGTWHHSGLDIVLDDWNQTLVGGVMTDRSVVLTTYMLCGFSNVTSIAVGIGALASLVPTRATLMLKHATRTAVAANIASFLTGCVAGLLYR